MTDSEGSGKPGDGDRPSIPSDERIERAPQVNAERPSTSAAAQPQPGTSTSTSAGVERQNSTASTRSDAAGERRAFSFLEFDGNGPPRHIQALNMIQEWARNSVNATIPILGSEANERARLAPRQNDTQIPIPGGEGPLPQPPPTSSGPFSLSSRLARPGWLGQAGWGLLQPLSTRRRSEETADIPVLYNQSTSTTSVGLVPTRDRGSLTLDLETGGGSNSDAAWNEGRNTGGTSEGGNNNATVPEEAASRPSGSGDGQAQSGGGGHSPGGSATTPNQAGSEGSQTPHADILRDSPETRAFIEEINQYTTLRPFLVLMLLKNLVDHGSGIVCFFALIVTFSHANSLLKKEISKQRKRNILFLLMITANLVGCAAFIYYVFGDDELYYALGFMSTKVDLSTFLMLMWVVGVTDYIAKFGAIVAKAFIVAMPSILIPFQKRGIYYLFIEQTSQLYRSALPVHPWLLYLINSYEGNMKIFGLILAGMYVLFKLIDSVQRVKDWQSAFKKLFQNVHYGTTLTAKELDNMDSVICPICHDTFNSPTRLSCSHVFCEECVSTWFDRGMTCPMCRAKVVDDPSFRDGTTAQYIQFF